MRRLSRVGKVILTIGVLMLAACGGTAGTSAKSATPTAQSAATAPPSTATPAPPTAPATVYVGVGSAVYALDAHTGSRRWTYNTSQPTNFGNIQSIFAGAGAVFFDDYGDNSLYALDATTGALRWKIRMIGIANELTVVQGVVYASSEAVQAPEVTYAVNLLSGSVLWQVSEGGALLVTSDATYLANTQPSAGAAPPTNGVVRAYNRLTGLLLWQVTGHPFGGVSVAGGVLYTTADNTLYAYDAHSGAALWTAQLASPVGIDQLIGNILYLSNTTQALAFDVTTHKVLWQFSIFNGYMAIGDNVICLANHGNLYGLNAMTGATLWSVRAADGYASVTYGSNTCFANTFSNDRSPLYAVDATTGRPRWSSDIKYIYNSLQPSPDTIYVISNATAQCCASLITALSISDGSTRWTFAPPSAFPGQFVLG